jgi:hypothetical protein
MPAGFNDLERAGLLWRNSSPKSKARLLQETATSEKGCNPTYRWSGISMTTRPWPSTAIALGTVVLEMLCNQEEMKNLLPDLHYKKESF